MATVKVKVEYEENGVDKTEYLEMNIDKDVNQEIYFQWYDDEHGGYAADGIGGRPNDRGK